MLGKNKGPFTIQVAGLPHRHCVCSCCSLCRCQQTMDFLTLPTYPYKHLHALACRTTTLNLPTTPAAPSTQGSQHLGTPRKEVFPWPLHPEHVIVPVLQQHSGQAARKLVMSQPQACFSLDRYQHHLPRFPQPTSTHARTADFQALWGGHLSAPPKSQKAQSCDNKNFMSIFLADNA